jgi:hypothetical protein
MELEMEVKVPRLLAMALMFLKAQPENRKYPGRHTAQNPIAKHLRGEIHTMLREHRVPEEKIQLFTAELLITACRHLEGLDEFYAKPLGAKIRKEAQIAAMQYLTAERPYYKGMHLDPQTPQGKEICEAALEALRHAGAGPNVPAIFLDAIQDEHLPHLRQHGMGF